MLNNANLEIARQFVWTMSRLKVNYFPTQASLYRAIETIKFPHLNRSLDNVETNRLQQLSDWRLSVSPYNKKKNVYIPKNYQGIVDFLTETGFLVTYYTWIKNGKVRQRAYAADFKIPGIRSEIGELRGSDFKIPGLRSGIGELRDSTEFWQVTPEITKEYESWSKLDMSARFPVMSLLSACINVHKNERKERKRISRKLVVETKFVESNYDFKFATGVQVPQSVLSLTGEELQELYYLVGIGAMCGQLSNKTVADKLINKVSALICSK